MDGWNTILSYWVLAYFQVLLLLVSGRVGFTSIRGFPSWGYQGFRMLAVMKVRRLAFVFRRWGGVVFGVSFRRSDDEGGPKISWMVVAAQIFFFIFIPITGEMIQVDYIPYCNIFSDGWFNHQLVSDFSKSLQVPEVLSLERNPFTSWDGKVAQDFFHQLVLLYASSYCCWLASCSWKVSRVHRCA